MSSLTTTEASEVRAALIEVYNLYRTALLNRKYYARRLTLWRRWNTTFEIALALGTSGTIGAWVIWKNGPGEHVWTFVAAFAAILGVLKPIVQLSKGIERYSKLFVGHSDLFYDLQSLVADIQRTHGFTPEMLSVVRAARDRFRKLSLEDDPTPNKRQVRNCYVAVNREIPPESLWVPT